MFDDLKDITDKLILQLVAVRRAAAECRTSRGDAMATLANIDDSTSQVLEDALVDMASLIEEQS